MKTIKNTLTLLLAFATFSCSKDDEPKKQPTVKDVHVVGYEKTNGKLVAKYWKNGIGTNLASGSVANAVFVSGKDVYISGFEYFEKSQVGRYWKNGIVNEIENASSFYSIYVKGQDIYLLGYQKIKDEEIATYWKNGVAVPLSDGTNSTYLANLIVVGSDVYVCGTTYFEKDRMSIAKYWKNGVGVNLTNKGYECYANDIEVVGNDIYVAGREGIEAKYWKNEKPVTISTPVGFNYFAGNAIAINGSDVYVGGLEETPGPTQARIWKNGTVSNLNDANLGQVYDIAVTPNGDVYAVGVGNKKAKFWKNGLETTLSIDASDDALAKAIALTFE